jgi:hypothetical protein
VIGRCPVYWNNGEAFTVRALGPAMACLQPLKDGRFCPGRLSIHTSESSASSAFYTLPNHQYFLDNMSNFPKLKLIDHSAFPSQIRMPDIAGYTAEVFPFKVNPNWKEAEAGSYAWFDSYSMFLTPFILGRC